MSDCIAVDSFEGIFQGQYHWQPHKLGEIKTMSTNRQLRSWVISKACIYSSKIWLWSVTYLSLKFNRKGFILFLTIIPVSFMIQAIYWLVTSNISFFRTTSAVNFSPSCPSPIPLWFYFLCWNLIFIKVSKISSITLFSSVRNWCSIHRQIV